jgi:hypothetical protein
LTLKIFFQRDRELRPVAEDFGGLGIVR